MTYNKTRSRIQERREQRRRKGWVQSMFLIGIGAALMVGLLILLTIIPSAAETETSKIDWSQLTQETVRSDNGGIGFAVGDPDAPVTMVEYSDFSCRHCRDLSTVVHRLIDTYVRQGNLRIIYKPIGFINPDYSRPAAKAAICAGEQGMFWQMHDAIWSMSSPAQYTRTLLLDRAKSIGLDGQQFIACFDSSETDNEVDAVIAEAGELGINSTPTIFINGEPFPYRGLDEAYGDLSAKIDELLGG
ncbi:MAG: thioredoxin domain-containing protein [Candidatus Hadarchaeum sp.]